jgi:hypothetical protein
VREAARNLKASSCSVTTKILVVLPCSIRVVRLKQTPSITLQTSLILGYAYVGVLNELNASDTVVVKCESMGSDLGIHRELY